MSAGRHNKQLLKERINRLRNAFLLSDKTEARVPAFPSSPFISATSREDDYRKVSRVGAPNANHQVLFVEKNNKPYGFAWRTTAKNLSKGVRWGIIPAESATGKVIGALGHYRVITHERAIKGLISNTHRAKIGLLDHYQDRFEALQEIESLVNRNNIATLKKDYKKAFGSYVAKLRGIQHKMDIKNLGAEIVAQLRADIEKDIRRANRYYFKVSNPKNNEEALKAFNRARGNDSVLEFVKKQMTFNLYEMQGINQDITYSTRKTFSLTRGAMNDCIEDARKILDDHRADLRSLVLPQHHGIFGQDKELLVYNFKEDHLTPEREREVLGAISGVEEWDKIIYDHHNNPKLYVANSPLPLTVTAATNWRSSVSWTVFFKKMAWTIATTLLSVVGRTQPVDENPWQEKDENGKYKFNSFSAQLRRSSYVRTYRAGDAWYTKIMKMIFPSQLASYSGARPNEPLWRKPFDFLAALVRTGKNIMMGFAKFLTTLFYDLWRMDIYYDYKAAEKLREWKAVRVESEQQLQDLEKDFEQYIDKVNKLIDSTEKYKKEEFQPYTSNIEKEYVATARLVELPYRFVPNNQNDIVNAVVRGVDGFASFFTHNFAKDPVGAVAFGTAYVFVGGSILLPKLFSFLGPTFTNWTQGLGLTVASGGMSSAVAGGCLVGQWGWGVVDVIEHGPQSGLIKTISLVLDDPLSIGVGVGAAWLAGHILTISIPVLRHDLGTNENIGKLTFGGKGAVALHEALEKAEQNPGHPIKFTVDGVELKLNVRAMTEEQKKQNKKFRFVAWLAEHHDKLPLLKEDTKHELARHIEEKFKSQPERAAALKKLIFPPKEHSIAHQLVTIPLSYIPALIRAVVSIVLSAVTGSLAPMERAWGALGKKMIKDLLRLVGATEGVIHLLGNVISTAFKIPALLIMMGVSRLSALFGFPIGHATHRFLAALHVGWREVGEMLFPVRAMKHVTEEHYCSVLEREHSTQKMLVEMKAEVKTVNQASIIPEQKNLDSDDEDNGAGLRITSSDCQGPTCFQSPRLS